MNNIKEMVEELFNNGASRTIKNSENLTPVAVAQKYPEILRVLQKPQRIGQRRVPVLTMSKPSEGSQRTAARVTDMVITDITGMGEEGKINSEMFHSIQDVLYDDKELLELKRGSEEPLKDSCQWLHIPSNNVSSIDASVPALWPN